MPETLANVGLLRHFRRENEQMLDALVERDEIWRHLPRPEDLDARGGALPDLIRG